MRMAFKTIEQIMEMCRQIRERSGMSQVEFGASFAKPMAGQRIREAEKDPKSLYDSTRIRILEEKGGYEVPRGYEVRKKNAAA